MDKLQNRHVTLDLHVVLMLSFSVYDKPCHLLPTHPKEGSSYFDAGSNLESWCV